MAIYILFNQSYWDHKKCSHSSQYYDSYSQSCMRYLSHARCPINDKIPQFPCFPGTYIPRGKQNYCLNARDLKLRKKLSREEQRKHCSAQSKSSYSVAENQKIFTDRTSIWRVDRILWGRNEVPEEVFCVEESPYMGLQTDAGITWLEIPWKPLRSRIQEKHSAALIGSGHCLLSKG